jgi:hypothetical protein
MDSLPEELILLVFSHLQPIRSYEPQSQAFKAKAKEKDRQRENDCRRKALYALSLTSRNLRRFAEPVLYSAFVGSLTWKVLRSIQLFHRSLRERAALAHHIQYIEVRLSDYLGNGLYHDLEIFGAVDKLIVYFKILANVIVRSINLTHLSVVSTETTDVSLWGNLIGNNEWPIAMRDHSKLQTVCLQVHSGSYGMYDDDSACFGRITNWFSKFPALKHLLVSGISSGCYYTAPDPFTSLTTIDISECMVGLQEIIRVVVVCNKLKRFGCHWAYLRSNSREFHLPDLYDALQAHRSSLEYFHLDAREAYDWVDEESEYEALGSLRGFDKLKTIIISEDSLLSTRFSLADFPDQKLPVRIAHLLPPSLRSFTLLLNPESSYVDDHRIDESFASWDLANDCTKLLPNLTHVRIESEFEMQAVNLPGYFRELGVKFELGINCPKSPFDYDLGE